MPAFEQIRLSINTTGSAGSATGSATTPDYIWGYLEWVYVAKHASLPNTSDLTLTDANGPLGTIWTLSNIAASGLYLPRLQVSGATGTGLTYDGTRTVNERIALPGYKLTAAIAQSDQLTTALVVTLCIARA